MTAKRREFDWNLPGTGLAFRHSSAIVLFMGRSPAGFKRSLKVQLLHLAMERGEGISHHDDATFRLRKRSDRALDLAIAVNGYGRGLCRKRASSILEGV
jgi:hypothetical protein